MGFLDFIKGIYELSDPQFNIVNLGLRIAQKSKLRPKLRFKDANKNVIDFSSKDVHGRVIYEDYMNLIYRETDYMNPIRLAVLMATIGEESGGNPYAVNALGNCVGLIQAAGERIFIPKNAKNLNESQYLSLCLENIINNTKHNNNSNNWNDGGKGTGYTSWKEAFNDYWNDGENIDYNDMNSVAPILENMNRGFSYGFIRPYTGPNDTPAQRKAAKDNRYQTGLIFYKKILNYRRNHPELYDPNNGYKKYK